VDAFTMGYGKNEADLSWPGQLHRYALAALAILWTVARRTRPERTIGPPAQVSSAPWRSPRRGDVSAWSGRTSRRTTPVDETGPRMSTLDSTG